jgi:paraquat-inducible protein A
VTRRRASFRAAGSPCYDPPVVTERSQEIACPVCGLVHVVPALARGTVATCVRCRSRITAHSRNSLHRTAAFSLAALILYVPANVLPILSLQLYGAVSDSTVWDGVVRFYRDQDYVIATVVLLASIVVPLLKLGGLFFVTTLTYFHSRRFLMLRTWITRFIETVGKWAMLDVFVVGIWVASVKMGSLADVKAGRGLLPFGCVVVLTLLASASFDPVLIWDTNRRATGPRPTDAR